MNQNLKSDRIIKTLEILHDRIDERFPSAGLAKVCADMVETAKATEKRVSAVRRPNFFMRFLILLVVVLGIAAQVYAFSSLDLSDVKLGSDALSLTQAIEAAANLLILAGAALWFLASLGERWTRRKVFGYLHELRSYAHVIDMHQLTKDPTVLQDGFNATKASPKREMTPFQLSRYLDYCSEMLALTGKLAALYAEHTEDNRIIEGVNEIEDLTTNLGRKIWQKIMMLDRKPVA